MHGTRLTALTTDKWWAEEENKFQRFSSSSDKIKLNKRDEREENLCFGEKEKEKPKQQCCKLSFMSGAAQCLLHIQLFSTISEATCEWIFLFSAPEMFSLLFISLVAFSFFLVFSTVCCSPFILYSFTHVDRKGNFLLTFQSGFEAFKTSSGRRVFITGQVSTYLIKVNLMNNSPPPPLLSSTWPSNVKTMFHWIMQKSS